MAICGGNATEFNEIVSGPVSLYLLKLQNFLDQNKVRDRQAREAKRTAPKANRK